MHWPVVSWQKTLAEPRGSHSHAVDATRIIRLPDKHLIIGESSTFTSAAGGAELVGGWGATVAVPAHDVGSTLTLATTRLAQCAERTLWVTLACWEILFGRIGEMVKSRDTVRNLNEIIKATKKPGFKYLKLPSTLVLHTHGSLVQQRRDAEDVAVADIRYGAFDDALAAFQAPVALEGIPRPLALDPVEHVHLSEPGYQHQLQRGEGQVIKDEPGRHAEGIEVKLAVRNR